MLSPICLGASILLFFFFYYLYKHNKWKAGLLVGTIAAIAGFSVEQLNIGGAWNYNGNFLTLGTVPILIIFLYFFCGVSIAVLSLLVENKFSDCNLRTVVEISLLGGAALLFYLSHGLLAWVFLATFGIIISKEDKRITVIAVGLIAFFAEYLIDYGLLIRTLNIYSYSDSYSMTVPLTFMLVAIFLGGVVLFDRHPTCPTSPVDRTQCSLLGGEWIDGKCKE